MPRTSFKQKVALLTFGLLLGIILLEVGLRASGAVLLHLQERANLASLKEKGKFVILCLGESTTALGGEDAYPRQLERTLNDRDTGVKFSVINKGIAATNTWIIANLLNEWFDQYHPDIVLAMIGINDGRNSLWTFQDVKLSPFHRFARNLRVYKLARLMHRHIVLTLRSAEISFAPERGGVTINENDNSASEPSEDFAERIAAVKKKIQTEHGNPKLHLDLGDLFLSRGRLAEAEEQFQRAEAAFPDLVCNRYEKITQLYYDQGLNTECARLGEKVITTRKGAIDPFTGTQMARAYLNLGHQAKAGKVCQMVLTRNPGNDPAWCYLGDAHLSQGRWREAETAYRRAVELAPCNIAFTHLMREYIQRKDFEKAEELGRMAVNKDPDDPRLLGALANCYQVQGKQEMADRYYNESAFIQGQVYSVETIENYRKIKKILDKQGIPLICVQYPMRSIEPLKKIFAGQEGIIFVDNEEIFKEAVKKGAYRDYFTDCFGGDFGHCTKQGNQILALNIADTILKVYFNQSGEK